MNDKQVVQTMLKVEKSTPNVHLSVGEIPDRKSKDYGKTFLYMIKPIDKKLYRKLITGNHNTARTYRTY